MPELPEVESARAVIERSALNRTIADVDDTDTYECRPHRPGEIRGVLVSSPDGASDEGGDYVAPLGSRRATAQKSTWDRFTITFADCGTLRLFDKRRLGRVRLNPDVDALGPDAGEITAAQFRDAVGRGTAPVKARLLDRGVLAGVGNLLADEALWQAEIDPRRPAGGLTEPELTALRRAFRRAIRSAIRMGGVHTGEMIEFRTRGAQCPRCGAPMHRATVGGRTTWWCSREQ
ncbi:MAG: formamidopyrimidine-DNA glycosylase [Jatrophihabitans sp.]